MDGQGVDTSLHGSRKARGLRKPRGASLGRAVRVLLLCVGALSVVGGAVLFRKIASSKLENEEYPLGTGFLSRELPAVQTLTAREELSALRSVEEGGAFSDGVSGRPIISRVGFGSCTSRVAIDQPIWAAGVIPSDIQAWIWAGDIAYTDWPDVNCAEHPSHPHCNCTRNWLHSNPDSCLAGDVAHARSKLAEQLRNADYENFVDFMCPALKDRSSGSPDLSVCERPILGTWDDHDYNWQDGDKRMPTKEDQKHLWLDAFGVPAHSPRRSDGRGIYWRHTLNEGVAGKEIDVLLLDERFHRDTKPCHTRRDLCKLTKPNKTKYIWCQDFLQGGPDGTGSCCKTDDHVAQGWCKLLENRKNPLWDRACNPKSPSYGFGVAVDVAFNASTNSSTVGISPSNSVSNDDSDAGVLCEILGPPQRRWLQQELEQSRAPLKLVVSGSPLISNPTNFLCSQARGKRPGAYCRCYDDFDCFQPAQQNLLHTIATAPGCVVVLTGDFHFSDIKVLQPGNQSYSDYYESADLPRPVVQVMASGLTNNTAVPAPCQGFRVDKVGLRPNGACGFVSGPAFGLIDVDWDASPPLARVQIRGLAGHVLLEQKLALDSCLPLK